MMATTEIKDSTLIVSLSHSEAKAYLDLKAILRGRGIELVPTLIDDEDEDDA